MWSYILKLLPKPYQIIKSKGTASQVNFIFSEKFAGLVITVPLSVPKCISRGY
jgi:hypothetical protein